MKTLIGKLDDPNIYAVKDYFDLFIDQDSDIVWDMDRDALVVNGAIADISSVFMRADVFAENSHRKFYNYYILKNYFSVHADVRILNRGCRVKSEDKLENLVLARGCGLRVPRTVAGSYVHWAEAVQKPINGGAHAKFGVRAPYPMIMQEWVKGVNKRVFIVGGDAFVFDVVGRTLDYRDDPHTQVFLSEAPDDIVGGVKSLMSRLSMDFGAADFIVDDGGWCFLEINSMPMFSRFDEVAGGLIGKRISEVLS